MEREQMMTVKPLLRFALPLLLAVVMAPAHADAYTDTIAVFRKASQSKAYFSHSQGYAVFPTVGKGGAVVGAAYGKGRVYERGRHIGDVSMAKVSIGAQLGGQAFSEIIFFEDKRALDEFTKAEFELGAEASAVAITAGLSAESGTGGTTASKSVTADKSEVFGGYRNGMAIFTVAKGGLMYEAAVAGQKFDFKRKP
jgi:lipid-binding SYLF domain-containing protein